jgi:hypothetical protein
MAAREGTVLKRLRAWLGPEVVAPEPEYVRHTAEERRQRIERLFGTRAPEPQEAEREAGEPARAQPQTR